ncbi:DNA-directed RNA polymerase [Trichuris trichiura]|uniref:DNA-directed RNA polymerase n=1 Tax=Trichuris trichiura TaxID=36087 RepID=A0A077Z5R8_TRITR|nr:DNA-directed RNA polymerase [Trichuris trichiura]
MCISTSLLQEMTFQTTTAFMKDAILNKLCIMDVEDLLNTPSGVVIGRLPHVGTGCFDILYLLY